MRRMDEVKVVGRSVIFGKTTPGSPHQTADGKIETRRTILPLVITVGREFQNRGGFVLLAQDVSGHPVDFRLSSAAFLIMKWAIVTKTCKHQTVPDTSGRLLISSEPRDGADCAG